MKSTVKELVEKHQRIWNLYTIGPVQQAEVEDFVEAVVQECIDYCGENLSKTVGGALKIHFGVE